MEEMHAIDSGRRHFLTRVVPACALTCLGAKSLFARALAEESEDAAKVVHTFDAPFDTDLTYRQFFASKYRDYIELVKELEKEWGRERTIEFLEKITTAKMTAFGKSQAGGVPENNFEAYVGQFREGYANMLTKEVVEDTDTAFELKVTECIWADTFLRADAGHIGYAAVCWGDYAWAESFNEKIVMVRDKTLMQGHDRCNHRYLWKG
jgi:hypothetical protein